MGRVSPYPLICHALAAVPANTLLGEAPPSISPDEVDLYWQDRVNHSCSDVGAIRARMKTAYVRKSSLHTGFVGMNQSSQLAGELAKFDVRNRRDLWGEPKMALRFLTVIGLFPGVYWIASGISHTVVPGNCALER